MVLTNFECWAQGGSSDEPVFVDAVIERRNPGTVDLFNPNSLQQYSDHSENNRPKIVSHLSSNGYYGFVAPICRVAIGNDASILSNNSGFCDVKITEQQQSGNVQMMDVEQHYGSNIFGDVRNSPHADDVAITGNIDMRFRNGSVRRKRFFIQEDYFQTQKFNAKRCRFDNQREQYLADNSNGDYLSTNIPTTIFPASVDHDEFPSTISRSNSDGYAVAAASTCDSDNSTLSAVNHRLAVNSSANDSANSKKLFYKNTLPEEINFNTPILALSAHNMLLSTKILIDRIEFNSSLVADSNAMLNTKDYENKSNYLPAEEIRCEKVIFKYTHGF